MDTKSDSLKNVGMKASGSDGVENLLESRGVTSTSETPKTSPLDEKKEKPKKGTWLDTLQMNPRAYWPKKYRYTVEPMPGSVCPLTIKERDIYEANGYIVIRNVLSKFLDEISKKGSQDDKHLTDRYIRLPELLKLVQCFCGRNIMAIHPTLFSKSTDERSREDAFHRTLFALPLRPADRIVVCLSPLEKSSVSLSSGSHKGGGLYSNDGLDTEIYEVVPVDELSNRREVLLNPGDTLFVHPLLNCSLPPTGRSLFSNFASSDCQFVEYLHQREDNLIPSHMKSAASLSVADWKKEAIYVNGQRSSL